MAININFKVNKKCPCSCHFLKEHKHDFACAKCLFKYHRGTSQRKPYENVERDYYIVGNRRLFFRSKMEANYALYLEFLKNRGDIKEWEYEKKTFVFEKVLYGVRSYKPDFDVTMPSDELVYHETKGHMDPRSKTKLRRMKIYYPEVKIVLIGRTEYRALSKWRGVLKWY